MKTAITQVEYKSPTSTQLQKTELTLTVKLGKDKSENSSKWFSEAYKQLPKGSVINSLWWSK